MLQLKGLPVGSESCFSISRLDAKISNINSIPAALQYEKFHIPDTIRVLDAMIETLQY